MSTDMIISSSPTLNLSTPISMSSSGSTPTTTSVTAAAAAVTVLSKCTIYPDQKTTTTTLGHLPLSVSDLPMLSCNYIQKGLFFPPPSMPMAALLSLLAASLSRALSLFPPLAGRLSTLPDHRIVISCDGSGVEFSYVAAPSLSLSLLLPSSSDVPAPVRSLFPFDGAISFHGHFLPLAAFQVTELGDGAVFVGAAINHSVTDGTSFWNFFNVWAELCRGGTPEPPDFRRNYFGASTAVLRFPEGSGPEVSFTANAPLRERIFCFSAEAIAELKWRANHSRDKEPADIDGPSISEILGKKVHDPKATAAEDGEISSFQALCSHIWQSVTRARKHLSPEATTTFRMAANCRSRVTPKVAADYFGNAIQSIPTVATVSDVTTNGHRWVAALLHRNVARHDDGEIKRAVAEWEASPACFPLGNPNGAGLTMGSSHRFPMYDGNDFGWGRPVAVRSGRANKFDGKMSAFPGRDGGGSVDVEVCLAPDTMAALLQDEEFMSYVSEQ